MNYNVIVVLDEDGMYIAECVELPGCISQGETKELALENIKDAIKGYIESVKKHPNENNSVEQRQMVQLVAVSL